MKKILLHCFTWLLISVNIFAGTLKVGATPVPHAELLNYLKNTDITYKIIITNTAIITKSGITNFNHLL